MYKVCLLHNIFYPSLLMKNKMCLYMHTCMYACVYLCMCLYMYQILKPFEYSHQINTFSNKMYKAHLDLHWIRTVFLCICIIHVFLYFQKLNKKIHQIKKSKCRTTVPSMQGLKKNLQHFSLHCEQIKLSRDYLH